MIWCQSIDDPRSPQRNGRPIGGVPEDDRDTCDGPVSQSAVLCGLTAAAQHRHPRRMKLCREVLSTWYSAG